MSLWQHLTAGANTGSRWHARELMMINETGRRLIGLPNFLLEALAHRKSLA